MRDGQSSITATESFAARAQRSESLRVALWIVTFVGLLGINILRRRFGGVSMSSDRVFWPTTGVLIAAILWQSSLLLGLRRANRRGILLPRMLWICGDIIDLLVPLGYIAIIAIRSPRGPIPALSGPALLLLPLVILLSILRLRPLLTLMIGLAAAAFHWAIVVRAIVVTDAPRDQQPVYFAYGASLLLTGVGAALVARAMRRHVHEAADEAVALERADQQLTAVHRDLEVARDIQRGLLPVDSPRFEGFEIAGMNRPADLTGGDYYDWQLLPDGRLVVALADVTGHGIGPALVMAVCRAYARASAAVIRDPALLMGRLNELLCADLPANRFITLVIAILQPDGQVQLLSAGHGPSLLYRAASAQVEEFGGDGLPLGVSDVEKYGPTPTLQMQEGDVLVLLTDGFFEWQRASDREPFGIPRLRETLARAAGEQPGAILLALDQGVRDFVGNASQQDDMTAVVIKRAHARISLRSGVQTEPGAVNPASRS